MSGKLRHGKGKGKHRSKVADNVVLPYEAKLGQSLTQSANVDIVSQAFSLKHAVNLECGIVLHNEPFHCCQLMHFIEDEHFLEGLRDELLDQIFYEKNNDLYSFQQTDDLKNITTPHVRQIVRLFNDEFRAWLSKVTGFSFTDKIDLTCSKYDYTDVLLCHDDELDSRRIAFALYLVPQWTESDGGSLDLFDMDSNEQPRMIVKSLTPAWNSLSWFEVTESSHHQVSEVRTEVKTRLSVNGWFHTLPVPRKARHIEQPRDLHPHIHIEKEMVEEWLNPIYLDAAIQTEIRQKFEEESEIELQEFLKEDKYRELMAVLRQPDLPWQTRGPPNKRQYCYLSVNNMPDIVRQCQQFLQSEAVFLTLSNLTGLRLHHLVPKSSADEEKSEEGDEEDDEDQSPMIVHDGGSMADSCDDRSVRKMSQESSKDPGDVEDEERKCKRVEEVPTPQMIKRQRLGSAEDSSTAGAGENKKGGTQNDVIDALAPCDPKCRFEVRRWRHGCYTLVHDTDVESCEYALDAVFYCMPTDWSQNYGGFTSYIAKGDDEELLTVGPAENSLALVYRDKDTLKFVKHVNDRTTAQRLREEAGHEREELCEFYDFSFVYYE